LKSWVFKSFLKVETHYRDIFSSQTHTIETSSVLKHTRTHTHTHTHTRTHTHTHTLTHTPQSCGCDWPSTEAVRPLTHCVSVSRPWCSICHPSEPCQPTCNSVTTTDFR